MSARTNLPVRVRQYLAERRRLGFKMEANGRALRNFARHVAHKRSRGALTAEFMVDWARQAKKGGPDAAIRRLMPLRPFVRWLRQFEPETEVPDTRVLGPEPVRVAPHIYQESELVQLLAAARKLSPAGSLRSVGYETLFGLLASTGLRISEALALRDTDVDLKAGVLTVLQTKFRKSRLVPIHPTVADRLARYRRLRSRSVPATPDMPFFVGTRGMRLGGPISYRQAARIFEQLRKQLGWANRGGHHAPRVHDLRHSFAVRRLILWYQQGADVDQHMLALSTYLGHAKISKTYWYLTGVPELVALAGARFEKLALEPRHG